MAIINRPIIVMQPKAQATAVAHTRPQVTPHKPIMLRAMTPEALISQGVLTGKVSRPDLDASRLVPSRHLEGFRQGQLPALLLVEGIEWMTERRA